MKRTASHILAIGLTATLLSGCGSLLPEWVGGAEESAPLPGKRISVLEHASTLSASDEMAATNIALPSPGVNQSWTIPNVAPLPHLAAPTPFIDETTVSIGDSPEDEYHRILSNPVIAGDLLFVMDGDGTVSAHPLTAIGNPVWEVEANSDTVQDDIMGLGFGISEELKPFLGGYIAVGNGLVVVTTAHGKVIALDALTGAEKWQRDFIIPVKSAPLIHNGMAFFITNDNTLYAVDALEGNTRWNYGGVNETTSIFGSASPVASGNTVLVPYSSGELVALDIKSGNVRWSKGLLASSFGSPTRVTLGDVDATPVISNNIVYAVGHDGKMVALDLYSGNTVWSQDISSISTPWVSGNFVFVLTSNREVVSLHAPSGDVKWIQPLDGYEDENFELPEARDKVHYSGPILAGGVLYLVASSGELVAISPEDGKVAYIMDIADEAYLPLVVAREVGYVLHNDGDVTILR